MRQTFMLMVWSIGLWSALALAVPTVGSAQDRSWEEGRKLLQMHLPAGRTPAFYRNQLDRLGYLLTSVNYSDPDYVEWEVVKGERSYEIQLSLDEETSRATDVGVVGNLWQADATEWALENPRLAAQLSPDDPEYALIIARSYHFSDRDRTSLQQMIRELEALPTGRDESFYRRALQRRGYNLLEVDSDTPGTTQWHAERDGKRVALTVDFARDTGESEHIDAYPLWWEAASTQRAEYMTEEKSTVASARERQRIQERGTQQRARSEQALEQGRRGTGQMLHELEALPVGRTESFYRRALQRRGYQITESERGEDWVRFAAEKNGREVALTVDFDAETGESTQVSAFFPQSARTERQTRLTR